MSVVIITDSTADLTGREREEHGIGVVPLKTIFADGEYLDGIDLTPKQFYEKLAAAEQLPVTSQPSPAQFEEVFAPAVQAGDEVVAVLISGKISGTVQSARIAAEAVGGGIHVVDSENTIIGLRLLVYRAIALRAQGLGAREIARRLDGEKKQIRLHALVDTLEYLQKGGRVSKAVAFAGTLLGIKPRIAVAGGEVVVEGKARGRQRGMEGVWKEVEKDGMDLSRPFALGYTGGDEGFEAFRLFVAGKLPGRAPMIGEIGSVVGTHVGPGAVAVAYFAPAGRLGENGEGQDT